uniref:RNA-directed DNA polymerase, eukaryota, reverse transcriptase zinc-binding domain protein n=1 Tax=Tanacetum cinerariifolium TaxID=118510 RepID=A0A6L2NWC0_TANCI|nr:RNA-directed DNA polymerase, eukaryota, reverse transcriptase zinc-binding domain protein [Tanacetum cinerariifolium]
MGIGVSSNVVAIAASLIGCSILTAPFNYLGVKVGSNMSRITSWDDVISKVSSRLSKWKLKLLSIGGRLFLLKSVLTSIPLYHMSIFKVPIGVLNHLEFIRRNFFYGVDGSDRKLAWIGRNMLQRKGINLMDFIQKKVDNGENTFFWDDSWLGDVALKVLYKRLYALEICKSISVAEKMGHPSLSHSFRRMPRGGVEQENYGLLCSKVADLVLPNISDRWCWSLEGSQFSVKSSCILIDNTILPKAEFPTRWLRVVPIKVNVHAWRVCLDKLPTRANLSLRGMDIPSIACPLYSNSTLKNHISHPHCEALKRATEPGQSSMSRDESLFVYNPNVLREQFAGLVIQRGLPFNHFDDEQTTRVFQKYCNQNTIIGGGGSSSRASGGNQMTTFLRRLIEHKNKKARSDHSLSSEYERYVHSDFVTRLQTTEFATFDVLGFWKAKETMFPVLSRMAMDILSVQATSVASEFAFSTSGRVLSIRRTRLTSAFLEMYFEEEILDAEVQANEAIPLSDEEIALDATSSEGSMSGPCSGREEADANYGYDVYHDGY